MGTEKVIDIWGDLQKQSGRRNKKGQIIPGKAVLDFKVSGAKGKVVLSDKRTAGKIAKEIGDTIELSLLSGISPAGTPLPPPSAATMRRRRRREKQRDREGSSADRKRYRRAKTNYRKRFRWQGQFYHPGGPGVPRGKFGVESGTLARSAKVTVQGDRFRVYFANIRGKKDKKGTSAVDRVFKKIPVWTARSMQNENMRRALRQAAKDAYTKRRLIALGQALRSARALLSLLKDAEGIVK